MRPEPFKITIADSAIDDLRRRLGTANWPGDFDNESGRYGISEAWLRRAIDYWRDTFDWRAVEEEINALPNFRVEIDGVPIHFIHVSSGDPDAIPLILSHGWPWSFWDYRGVIELLAKPAGAGEPVFDVVVPSLPGFAFSNPLRKSGIDVSGVAKLWRTLMQDVLGYKRFAAAGGDWGSLITAQLGHEFPEYVMGVHLTLPLLPGTDLYKMLEDPFPPEEQWMADRMAEIKPTIMSHLAVQSADPQTLAYALADSPVGLAAWLWERRLAWSDARQESAARDLDFLCTLASLYWFTNSVGTSMRIYWEHFSKPWQRLDDAAKVLMVPTGFAIAPKELVLAPRATMERLTNLRRWTVLERGGHFVPAEAPDAMVAEYRAMFGELG